MIFYGQLRAHNVLFDLSAEIFQSPALVELDFKLDLLGAGILVIGIAWLVVRGLLLQVLILNFDGDEQLDALVVLVLVTRHKGRLLGRWIRSVPRWLLGLSGSSTLSEITALLLLEVLEVVGPICVLKVEALSGAALFCYLALLVHSCQVAGQLSL